jgi:uncharacterized protein (TIGR00369 family)
VAEATWEERFDPVVAGAIADYTKRGGYPALLGMRVEEVKPGRVVVALPIRAELCSAIGVVHGGSIASMVDHALSICVYPLCERGKWIATTEFKINYVDYVKDGDGELRATAEVLSLRKRLAVARAEVACGERIIAHAQGTLYIRDPSRRE